MFSKLSIKIITKWQILEDNLIVPPVFNAISKSAYAAVVEFETVS
jgi:hypothetical protein